MAIIIRLEIFVQRTQTQVRQDIYLAWLYLPPRCFHHVTLCLASLYCITGMAIGSKLLSEQPARDRAEYGALRIAVRWKSVLVRVNTEQLHIYNYYFTSAVFKLWYASV